MDEQPDSDDGIERGVREGKVGRIGRDEGDSRIAHQPGAGCVEHRVRGVDEGHAVEGVVLINETAEPSSEIQQAPTTGRQEGPQGETVAPVLVLPPGPERIPVREVVFEGRGTGRRRLGRREQMTMTPTTR